MLLLHTSRRKILNVVHLSSMMSCCMNEVVEKGRVVQQSEDPCTLVVEYNIRFPLLGVNVDLLPCCPFLAVLYSLPVEYRRILLKPTLSACL